jgi:site-specific DNA-methyltransferase (adenine-specific)
MKYKIYNQDVIEWANEYQKGKFHALISDTPYHLTSIVKRFGKKNSAPAQYGTDGVFSRSSKGFMGQEWDGGDIAFRPETWEAIGEHLYPGAFGMCFSASRNWHRLAVAIEDAGMIIHPTIFGWLNGQGFPKATNISKQIQPISEQKIVGEKISPDGVKMSARTPNSKDGYHPSHTTYSGATKHDIYQREPTDEMALRWNGHRYGLQALKPAVEPIIVFQKPYEGKPLDNIVETGTGALNIDGGRIPTQEILHSGSNNHSNGAINYGMKDNREVIKINRFKNGAKPWGDAKGEEFDTVLTSQGRWPANFILDESVAPSLDAQVGTLTSGKPTGKKNKGNGYHENFGSIDVTGFGDSGGASRFFFNVQEQIDEADPIYYCGKVSPKERSAGLDERNEHPTLKPIALAKYLATLLLPPKEYAPRRILVPFSGVGSEMIGCALAGWEHIVGIEFMEEYVELAKKRIDYWSSK